MHTHLHHTNTNHGCTLRYTRLKKHWLRVHELFKKMHSKYYLRVQELFEKTCILEKTLTLVYAP
jgi:hypothetical protein